MARFLYAQRPSKHVQRRMVLDACRKLRAFAPLTTYQYVGFGAYEFIDFELCRRELGIITMHSIELNTHAQDRYTFNRPFSDIEIHFDRASNVLPDLLDDPVLRIVWLDYTGGLDQEVLQDVGTCIRTLQPGSVFVVTVTARPATPATERRAALVRAIGAERVAPEITDESLAKGLPAAQAGILAAEVAAQVTRRPDGAMFEHLFNIRYRDDQPMHTWGGVLVTPGMRSAFESARFDELEQVSRDASLVDATVEPLTTRETLHLNRQLPVSSGERLSGEGIPDDALSAYERLYFWYPTVPVGM